MLVIIMDAHLFVISPLPKERGFSLHRPQLQLKSYTSLHEQRRYIQPPFTSTLFYWLLGFRLPISFSKLLDYFTTLLAFCLVLELGCITQLKQGVLPSFFDNAAYYGNTDIANLLIESKADVNAQYNDCDTPLDIATYSGHIDIVKLLLVLDKGAKITTQDSNGWTPLHVAAYKGRTTIARLLIESEADVNNQNNYGWTPLNIAATEGYTTMVKLLLKSGANVNIANKINSIPLHEALNSNQLAVVELLLAYGSTVSKDFINHPLITKAREHLKASTDTT